MQFPAAASRALTIITGDHKGIVRYKIWHISLSGAGRGSVRALSSVGTCVVGQELCVPWGGSLSPLLLPAFRGRVDDVAGWGAPTTHPAVVFLSSQCRFGVVGQAGELSALFSWCRE